MKFYLTIFICSSTLLLSQKNPFENFPSSKIDSLKILKFNDNDFEKFNKIDNYNTIGNKNKLPEYKMLVKNIENPKRYSQLIMIPKSNVIGIPNAITPKPFTEISPLKNEYNLNTKK